MDGFAKGWIMSPIDIKLCEIINKFEREIEQASSIVEIRKLEKERNSELIKMVRVFLLSEDN